MNKIIVTLLTIIILVIVGFYFVKNIQRTEEIKTPEPVVEPVVVTPVQTSYKDLLVLENVSEGSEIESPLTIEGKARGMWYFEASFPVSLVNWDGLIIAEGIATADGEWMTTDYVPFSVTLTFDSPYNENSPDFLKRGALIFQKSNPSGLPENDDAFEVSVEFAPKK